MAWDGTGIDAADTPANAVFGRAGGTGQPQLRLLALIECGSHALLAAVFDGVGAVSEQALARRVLEELRPGMLLLADRNFPGYQLWGLAAATGADLAWRIKNHQAFVPLRRLPDGSFYSVMGTPVENVRYGQARAAGRPLAGPPAGHRVGTGWASSSTPSPCTPPTAAPAPNRFGWSPPCWTTGRRPPSN
ncbi:MAG: hypothetical protein M3Q47_00465 [Actinomycetota bacterium]|nr:hypothetical protein [Actinomycetota bacterium]